MASDQPRPRAIVLPFPADGQITPLLRLSKALSKMGFAVTFVNDEGNHARLIHASKQSGKSSTLEQEPNIRVLGLAGLSMEDTIKLSGKNAPITMIQGSLSMKKPFEELVEREVCAENCGPVTCIIYSYLMYWVPDIAARFGLRKVVFLPSSAASYLSLKGIHELLQQGLIPIPEDRKNGPIISLVPDLPIMLEDAPSLALNSSDSGIDVLCIGQSRMKEADWVLANTFEELEAKSIEQIRKEIRNFLPVAPLQSYAKGVGLSVEDRSCLEWLDTQAPGSVLYVAFGSVSVVSKIQLTNIARGVVSSKKPFLWVQRPTLSGDQDALDLISQVLDGGQGMVVTWAPQVEVLNHPSIGGFFTHCGWNSTLESISAGVPMLGWPCMSEQFLNLRFISEVCKIGLDFKDAPRDENGYISAEDIETRVLRLMDGSEGKECLSRIREVKESALKATSMGGSSNNNFQTFVDAMIKSC